MCQAQISTSDPKPLLNAGPWQPGPWVFGGPSQQGPFGFYRAVTTGPWIKTDVCSYKRKAFCFLFRPFILRACFMHFLNGQKVETSNSLFSLFLKRWGIICFLVLLLIYLKNPLRQAVGPVRYLYRRELDAHSLVIKRSHLLVFKRFPWSAAGPTLPKVLGFFFYHDGSCAPFLPRRAAFLRFPLAGF